MAEVAIAAVLGKNGATDGGEGHEDEHSWEQLHAGAGARGAKDALEIKGKEVDLDV